MITDTKVWAVWSGDYSSYAIHCCCTTRNIAIQYAASLNGLTIAEQERFEELHHLAETPETRNELKALSHKTKFHDYRIEPFDLYDQVPHANPAT